MSDTRIPAATATTFDEAALASVAGSVWLTGQVSSRDQRRGRYTAESMTHPGKMLPSIARHLIATYTDPGDVVLDPMAGIGTTIVEAMHLGRHGIGVEYEPRWVRLAADNIALARSCGATGTGEVFLGDARQLPALVPADLHGRVSLVITSPPYGPSTHGHARTPGPRQGKVLKLHHRYGADRTNLAYQDHEDLAAGFTAILTGCATLVAPGGHVAVTARPYRRHGELVDIPGMVIAAGTNAGLTLVDRCVALIAGVRDGRLVPRASFFQLRNVRNALSDGDPQWLVAHEDVAIFAVLAVAGDAAANGQMVVGKGNPGGSLSALTNATVAVDDGLDPFPLAGMDRRPQPVHSTTGNAGSSATDSPSPADRKPGRTTAPCLPHSQPTSAPTPSKDAIESAQGDHPCPHPGAQTAAQR